MNLPARIRIATQIIAGYVGDSNNLTTDVLSRGTERAEGQTKRLIENAYALADEILEYHYGPERERMIKRGDSNA